MRQVQAWDCLHYRLPQAIDVNRLIAPMKREAGVGFGVSGLQLLHSLLRDVADTHFKHQIAFCLAMNISRTSARRR